MKKEWIFMECLDNINNMKNISIVLIIFGIAIIAFPKVISYLVWGAFLFIGINMFLIWYNINAFWKKGSSKKDYVKFGDYKIFRGKK